MKRTPIERYTPLTAKTGLQRTVALGRSPLARSTLHAGSAPRKATKRRDTGPSAKVRALVHARSGGWCEWAGCWLVASQIHHRRPRRMGGSTDPASNRPSNLLDLCSADHEYAESHRAEALQRGVLLHASADPRAVPVLSRHGLVWLTDDGAVSTIDPTKEDPMPITRFRKKPVEVEAAQWDGTAEGATPIIDWILTGESSASYVCSNPERCAKYDGDTPHSIVIRTLEGDMAASVGDWIIRGVRGEFYPCKPEIFDASYEKAAS